jgi:DoxX-like protein
MAETVETKKRGASFWIGWVLSVLPALLAAFSGAMKLSHAPQVLEGFKHFGYPESTLTAIGLLEVLVAILVLVPRTAVLGAILFTGYFGGAVATHVRIGEPMWIGPVILGVLVWLGLWLREPRLRALAPLRR